MSQNSSQPNSSDQNQLVIHGIYRHYKGDYYIVEDVATHSETGEELVIYRGLYNGEKFGQHHPCARPKDLFLSRIEPEKCAQGHVQTYRFELQDIKSVAEH